MSKAKKWKKKDLCFIVWKFYLKFDVWIIIIFSIFNKESFKKIGISCSFYATDISASSPSPYFSRLNSDRFRALFKTFLNSDVRAVWYPAEFREIVICESKRWPSCLPNAAIKSFRDIAKSLAPSSLESWSTALKNKKSSIKWSINLSIHSFKKSTSSHIK